VEIDDFIGGLMLWGAALLQAMSVLQAYRDKMVAGVHPATVFYWMSLNAFYVYFFARRDYVWSMSGEAASLAVFSIWLCQYFYYKRRRV